MADGNSIPLLLETHGFQNNRMKLFRIIVNLLFGLWTTDREITYQKLSMKIINYNFRHAIYDPRSNDRFRTLLIMYERHPLNLIRSAHLLYFWKYAYC